MFTRYYCTAVPYIGARQPLWVTHTHQAGGDDGVGDMDHGWRRRRHRTCVKGPACTHAPDGARPHGERKDALDTVAGVEHKELLSPPPPPPPPWASSRRPRHHIRRRLRRAARCVGAFVRRRTTCTARARTQRHRLVAARARAGPTWESERSSSVARASRRAAKGPRAQVDGKWRDGWEPLRPPTRLEPAAAGRRRAEQSRSKERLHKFLDARTHEVRASERPSQYEYPEEEAAALAFLFQGPQDNFPHTPRLAHATTHAERSANGAP